MSLLATVLVASMAPAVVQGTAVDSLTLSEAIQAALSGNHRLTSADASVDLAESEVDQAKGGYRPRIDVAEIFTWTTNPALVFANKLGQEDFGVEDFAVDSLNNPDALTNFQTRLDIYQPIWVGGKNRAFSDAADHGREAALAQRERTRQVVIHDVVAAYTAALLTEAQRDVARESLRTAEENVRMVSDLHDGGLVVRSDLLQAQVRRSELTELLARSERGVAVALARLNLVMGRDAMAPLNLASTAELPAEEIGPDSALDALVAEAIQQRPDLQAAERHVLAAESLSRATQADRRPEVGVLGSLEANQEDYPGASGSNWTVMAVLKWNVFNGGQRKAKTAGALAELQMAREQAALVKEGATLQVIEAWHGLRTAHMRVTEADRSVELGREGLRIVGDRYREGLTTLVELLDAETALTRARARELAARRDVLVSQVALDLAVGRL